MPGIAKAMYELKQRLKIPLRCWWGLCCVPWLPVHSFETARDVVRSVNTRPIDSEKKSFEILEGLEWLFDDAYRKEDRPQLRPPPT